MEFDEGYTFYRWDHGQAEESNHFDTPEEALADGETAALWHKDRWGYRNPVKIEKVTVQEAIVKP